MVGSWGLEPQTSSVSKAQLTHTLNNLANDWDRQTTPKYVLDEVSTVRRAVRSFLAVVYVLYANPDDWIFPSTKDEEQNAP